jgi:hypothetical protein
LLDSESAVALFNIIEDEPPIIGLLPGKKRRTIGGRRKM